MNRVPELPYAHDGVSIRWDFSAAFAADRSDMATSGCPGPGLRAGRLLRRAWDGVRRAVRGAVISGWSVVDRY
ncbi:hypothetical protein GCM10027168_16720 [Streptomyces capparidis]